MDKKKQLLISIGLVFLLVLMVMGVSYAAFTFIGSGERLNTITTGVISMEYKESSNVISINKALPTTDATGKKRLTEGEYFDFTVLSNIKGSTAVNYEIAAEDVTSSTVKKIDGSHIKLYLTKINSDGTETEVMAPKTFKTSSANQYTGKPSGMMSLERNTTGEAFNTKYRLRMYVDENYNPQGDGGDLKFSVRINVYGKVTSESMPQGGTLKAYMMPSDSSSTLPETDFHTAEYKEKITSITTKKDNIVPATALASFDVSDEQNKSVMAYVEDDGTGAGTYKLTIGGRNGIIANESMKNYFHGFKNAKTIDLSNLDTSFTTSMYTMFFDCSSLVSLDLSNFDTSQLTDISAAFMGCTSLTKLNISNFNFSRLVGSQTLFGSNANDNLVVNMSGANFEGLNSISGIFFGIPTINLQNSNFKNVNLSSVFSSVLNVDLEGSNFTNANMSQMFATNSKLKAVNLKNVITTGVKDMNAMFVICTNLTSLDLSSFDTSSVTNMSSMFNQCTNLTTLDLTSFDTSKVTNMNNMFYGNTNLTNIKVSNKWVVGSATTVEDMFTNCGTDHVTVV